VLRLEQRRVAGREPPWEQRLEGQPEYSEELRVHLHRHRAPIMAIQPPDILPMGIRATRSRAMDIPATRDTRLTRVLPATAIQATAIQATRASPLTPVPRAMDIRATRASPLTPVHRAMDTRAARHTLPTPVPVPVMDIPCLVIPETALRRTGRLGPTTLSSLLAELRPTFPPQCLSRLSVARANAVVKSIALYGWATLDRSSDPRVLISSFRGNPLRIRDR
jgi:hypothetical protein